MFNSGKGPFFDKKYLTRVLTYVSLTVFTIGVILYLGFHLSGSMKHGIETAYARSQTIAQSVKAQGYIIKDETPIDTDIGGGFLSPTVADGSKVRVGMKVADVYTSSSSAVKAKINLLEEQIAFYEKCKSTHLSVGDTSSVNTSITSSILSMRRALTGGDATRAEAYKSQLTLDVRKLGVLTGKVTNYDEQIASLKAEVASLKASLGSVVNTVYATGSGYYFSATDGYEEVFSSSDIDALTYSDVTEMISRAKEISPEQSSAGKIVSSFKWYVACHMSAADAGKYKVGRTYEVKLHNNASNPVDMTLYKVLKGGADAVVLFECSVIPDGFDYTRSQECEITYGELAGFKIPVSAVRYLDGYEGVFILDEVTVKFRRISVIKEGNGYYLCEADVEEELQDEEDEGEDDGGENGEGADVPYYAYLRENDVIITSGTGLYVGMTYNP